MRFLTPDDAPPALPCWINGRAFLSLTEAFVDVIDRDSGQPVRRTPLCGAAEVEAALAAAQAAAPAWRAQGAAERERLLVAWGALLQAYRDHFARLLRQEAGGTEAAAGEEISAAVHALGTADAASAAPRACVLGEIAIFQAGTAEGLAEVARALAVELRAGLPVVINPDAAAPGAIYALCELSARAGLPAGVVNLVQGREAVTEVFASHMALASQPACVK
ncbi:MAG: aldehyde dehydrogenase family protein [Zoogloeaceae bacterium]|jgi:acyl-CoA reductase-like NAD-dependent aldehyde dehydrogenase|nr:aldehyde dehydrogenase family protein [Zoogloeaceae bacterium]